MNPADTFAAVELVSSTNREPALGQVGLRTRVSARTGAHFDTDPDDQEGADENES